RMIVVAVVGKLAPVGEIGLVAGEGKDRGQPQLEREDQRGGAPENRGQTTFIARPRVAGFLGSMKKRGLSPVVARILRLSPAGACAPLRRDFRAAARCPPSRCRRR